MFSTPPTRLTSFSWSARRILPWSGSERSPISSRKSVEPLAASKRPAFRASAPVNEPFSWPKSSLSRRFSGIAAQLRAGVDRARDQLLARAGLAADEDRRVRRRDLLDEPEDVAHRGAVADDRLEAVALQAPLEAERPLREPERVDGALDAEEELVRDDGLRHVVERAERVGLARPLDGAVRGHEDHLRRERPVASRREALDDVHAREAGHLEVREDDLGAELGRLREGFAAVRGGRHAVALVLEDHRQRLPLVLLVVHDEDRGFRFLRAHGRPMILTRRPEARAGTRRRSGRPCGCRR